MAAPGFADPASHTTGRPDRRRLRPTDLGVGLIAMLGAVAMLLLAFGLILPPDGTYMLSRVYDLYLKALLDGRYDLPLRVLHFEGHYTPDGTGYLYHGLGPLLTRLPFAGFVDLPTTWIAPLSIWFWSVAGNLACHRAFALALERAGAGGAAERLMLAAMIWFGAPGILLASNGAIFQEPVAMAYALGGGIVLILARLHFGLVERSRALVPLALLAGLAVHARPHLAVGYYVGAGLLIALTMWRPSPRDASGARRRAITAAAILGVFGLALIASNMLRFQSAGQMHGTFEKGAVQYGWVFWEAESQDSDRVKGFEKYGQFNARRIPAAAMMYLAEPPRVGALISLRKPFEAAFRAAGPQVRYMRLEQPNIGIIFLWPLWLVLALVGLCQRTLRRPTGLAGMAAVTTGGLLMLSYATITLRYHVDLWPLLAFPALFGVAPLVAWARRSPGTSSRAIWARRAALSVLMVVGVWMTSETVGDHRNDFRESTGSWTYESCQKLTARKGFDAPRRHALCKEG